MPFQKGHAYHAPKVPKGKKTVWIMESLKENGYDYEKMLVKFLKQASDPTASVFERKTAYDMAALLIKLVPHLAHAPKNDGGTVQIDTLVINRCAPEGHPPSIKTTATEEPRA